MNDSKDCERINPAHHRLLRLVSSLNQVFEGIVKIARLDMMRPLDEKDVNARYRDFEEL